MSIPNKSSRDVWAYQGAVGTAAITAVNSISYVFGNYNDQCGKWKNPYVENDAIPSWVYASRTPTLTNIDSKFPTFVQMFNPTTIQWLAWILKSPTNTTPTVTVAALNSKQTYPLTIRLEEKEGTNPTLTQAVDCYAVSATAIAEREKSFMTEMEFAWGKLQDIGNYPILTTAPLYAGGLSTEKPYNGNPLIVWDVGGTNTSIPDIWRAEFHIEQTYEIVSGDEGLTQLVYCHKIQPVQLILHAVFKTNTLWDDYVDRISSKTLSFTVKKHNDTNYQTFTFTNCRFKSYVKTGDRNKGHYAAIATALAEKVEGVSDFFTEGGTDFTTHFKAAIA